jgi:outer membrane autotransporter protein
MVEDAKSYTDHFGIAIPELKSRLGQAKLGPDIGYSFRLGDDAIVEPHASLQLIWNYANDATAPGYATITPDPASSAGMRGKADFGLHVLSGSGMALDASGSYDGIGSKGVQVISGGAKVSVPLN